MNRYLLLLAAAAAFACKKAEPKTAKPAPPPADNAATQYTADLQKDLEKAEDAAKKANAAIGQTSQQVKEATETD